MRLAPILLALLLGACASPYRADVGVTGDASLSTDARYFLVVATGGAKVRAVDKATGAVLWEYQLPAGTDKAWLRSGKQFREVPVAEAEAALGMATETTQ
jgi:hypothetical protein